MQVEVRPHSRSPASGRRASSATRNDPDGTVYHLDGRLVIDRVPGYRHACGPLLGVGHGVLRAQLAEANASDGAAEAIWVDFIARLWPLTHRYRVLLALRRGEYGQEIHALLGPVDKILADLVQRGQDTEVIGRHLPADILSQIASAAVFAIADSHRSNGTLDARAATITSLLILGVPEPRAQTLVGRQP